MTSNSYGPKSTAATVFAVALVVGYVVLVGVTVGCNADRGARPVTHKTVDRFVPTGADTVAEADPARLRTAWNAAYAEFDKTPGGPDSRWSEPYFPHPTYHGGNARAYQEFRRFGRYLLASRHGADFAGAAGDRPVLPMNLRTDEPVRRTSFNETMALADEIVGRDIEVAPMPRPAGAAARLVGWRLTSRDTVGDKVVSRFAGVGGQNGGYVATVYHFPAGTAFAAGRHMAGMAEDLRPTRTALAPRYDADGLGFRAVAHGGRGTSRYAMAARTTVDKSGRIYVTVVSRSLATDEDARDAAADASERSGSLGESVAEAENADRPAARPALTNADVD